MKKVALITLGCSKNLVDSEVMLGYLKKRRYTFVSDPQEAEIIIINTCGFIQPAKIESTEAITHSIQLKKKYPPKKVIAVGCYVQRYLSQLQTQFPEVDAWLGVNEFHKITQVVEDKSFQSTTQCFLYDHNSPRILSTPLAWTYIKISEGCSHECSFCAIPLIKGPYRSRPVSSIVEEAKNLASRGIKEINLISQDSTYYGRDRGLKQGLSTLLQELIAIPNLEWIRVLYGYPEEINDSLLEIMQEEKICSYLDIPFQHSDSKIIRKMKRAMDGPRALKLIEKIRDKLPHVALRTSVVVGFPGEGQKEFQNLKSFVKEAQFDHLGVFTYSPEEGTLAHSWGDPVKENIKQERKEKIMEIQSDISFQNNRKYLNRKVESLIEGNLKQNPQLIVGRGCFQAPEVDGVIFIQSNKDKHISEVANTIQKVEITNVDIYDLYAKWIE